LRSLSFKTEATIQLLACWQTATEPTNMQLHTKNAFAQFCGIATAILIAGAMSLIASQSADATTKYAAQTGKPCAQCHQEPTGSMKLTPFGEEFKANGHELPKEPKK
jgi:hypothetical protein